MNILVTGAAGYIGSVLCQELLTGNYGKVVAVDSFRYGAQQALSLAQCCKYTNFELYRGDVRDSDLMQPLLKKADVVIHLAALVGAPLCKQCPDEAIAINSELPKYIAHAMSKDQLLIYPNTNSGYGMMGEDTLTPLDEAAELKPISLYGQTKCEGEKSILSCHENSVVFRLATVFGVSPRMRTDLMVNDFVLRAVKDRTLVLYEPHFRRNFVHVDDVVRAFIWAMTEYEFKQSVYNLGHDGSNVTKLQLCEKIKEHIPEFQYHIGEGEDPDKRDYLISNQLLRDKGFEARCPLDDGIIELIQLYKAFPVTGWGNV